MNAVRYSENFDFANIASKRHGHARDEELMERAATNELAGAKRVTEKLTFSRYQSTIYAIINSITYIVI